MKKSKKIKKVKNFLIVSAITLTLTSTTYADLLDIYTSSGSTRERSQLTYEFGVNSPVLNKNQSGAQKVFDLNAGIDANRNSCSILGDLKANFKSFFNAEKLIQGVTQNVTNFVSSAPYTLMCYASQTLCDMTKFLRNMANFTAQMNVTSCQEYEKLASDLSTSMRKKKVNECAIEKAQSNDPTEYQQYLTECEREVENLPIQIPGTSEQSQGKYTLKEQMQKIFTDQPEVAETVSKLLGDFTIGYKVGIRQSQAPLYGEDAMLSEYIEKYNNAISDIVEGYINDGRVPSDNEIKLISIPGMPLTKNVMDRISFMNSLEREDFYDQYSTVAGMYALTMKIEEAMKALEVAKNQNQDENARKVLIEQINALKDKYDLMYKRLTLQKDFLVPMMKTIMTYQPPEVIPNVRYHNVEPLIPKPITSGQNK